MLTKEIEILEEKEYGLGFRKKEIGRAVVNEIQKKYFKENGHLDLVQLYFTKPLPSFYRNKQSFYHLCCQLQRERERGLTFVQNSCRIVIYNVLLEQSEIRFYFSLVNI